ncbi:MAG: hypothetical protein V6Z89_03140 [Desulfobacter sp.]
MKALNIVIPIVCFLLLLLFSPMGYANDKEIEIFGYYPIDIKKDELEWHSSGGGFRILSYYKTKEADGLHPTLKTIWGQPSRRFLSYEKFEEDHWVERADLTRELNIYSLGFGIWNTPQFYFEMTGSVYDGEGQYRSNSNQKIEYDWQAVKGNLEIRRRFWIGQSSSKRDLVDIYGNANWYQVTDTSDDGLSVYGFMGGIRFLKHFIDMPNEVPLIGKSKFYFDAAFNISKRFYEFESDSTRYQGKLGMYVDMKPKVNGGAFQFLRHHSFWVSHSSYHSGDGELELYPDHNSTSYLTFGIGTYVFASRDMSLKIGVHNTRRNVGQLGSHRISTILITLRREI